MFSRTMRWGRRGLLPAALGTLLAGMPAGAQNRAALPPGAVVQPLDTGPGAELRRNLTTLADNPRSLTALNGAGRAALAMGDAEAALGFFARATEADPRSARAKAGMASALVLLERPRDALPLFAEAIALGAPDTEIAGDRGLAHDMLGDPRRAQADYALALRGQDDPEVRRRLALSLAISGQRAAALRTIDAQLRAHDRAAWRTQAFILALTGDAAGADRIAHNMMPAGARELAPFFARLASLSPAQKAMAVHFGHFPSDGRPARYAGGDTSADPGALALAQGGPPPAPPRARPRPAEPIGAAERRRPDGDGERIAGLAARSTGEVAPAVERQAPPPLPPEPQPRNEEQPPTAEPPPAEPAPVPVGEAAPADEATAGFTIVAQGEQPALPQPASPPPAAPPPAVQAPPPPQAAPTSRLGDLSEVVASLPTDEEARPARTEPRPAPQRTAARARPAPPSHPSRHWVQIAGGANRGGLPATFARLRGQAPALLGGRAAHTTPLNQTNRLLVGPFQTPRAAQDFVNQLAERDVAAFAWTSPAGQEIERLRTPNEPRPSRSRSEPEQRPAARGRRTN